MNAENFTNADIRAGGGGSRGVGGWVERRCSSLSCDGCHWKKTSAAIYWSLWWLYEPPSRRRCRRPTVRDCHNISNRLECLSFWPEPPGGGACSTVRGPARKYPASCARWFGRYLIAVEHLCSVMQLGLYLTQSTVAMDVKSYVRTLWTRPVNHLKRRFRVIIYLIVLNDSSRVERHDSIITLWFCWVLLMLTADIKVITFFELVQWITRNDNPVWLFAWCFCSRASVEW